MAFIYNGAIVTSYAEAVDVQDKDQRLFEANEINFSDAPDAPTTLDQYIEDLTTKATTRLNYKIRASGQWQSFTSHVGIPSVDNNIPNFNSALIIGRQSDFTDMCAYYTLKEFILPKIADFGNPESPEVMKMEYYEIKFNDLFTELLEMINWYDVDADGAIQTDETRIRTTSRRRSRGGASSIKVR